jgi:transposase
MPRKIYKPEEIVAKLRQVDVLTSQGQSAADAIRTIGVSEVTYYRWRQEFGGLKNDQVLYAYHPSRHLPPAKVRAFIDFVLASVASAAPDRAV